MFAHRFDKAGVYYIQVTDYQHSRTRQPHLPDRRGRVSAGDRRIPSGRAQGRGRRGRAARLPFGREDQGGRQAVARFRGLGHCSARSTPSTRCASALGTEPEIESQGGAIPVPVTVNGRIAAAGAANRYRFRRARASNWSSKSNARRLGSDLDSASKCSTRTASRSSVHSRGRSGRPRSLCETTIPRAAAFASRHGTASRPAIT